MKYKETLWVGEKFAEKKFCISQTVEKKKKQKWKRWKRTPEIANETLYSGTSFNDQKLLKFNSFNNNKAT